MTFPATTLPSSNDGYVAAAYIVFFAIVLVYVAIMAVRLGRVEKRVRDLGSRERETDEQEGQEGHEGQEGQEGQEGHERQEGRSEAERERETV